MNTRTIQTVELTCGPFAVPLTDEQREAMDLFVATGIENDIPVAHVKNERMELAVATIPAKLGRVS